MCRRATASVSCSMALALSSGLRSPLCASASACFFAASARSLSRSSLRSAQWCLPEPSPSRAEPRAWRVLGGVSAVSGVLRSMCRRATASVSCSMALALSSGLKSPLCASASACFFAASARSLSRSSLRSAQWCLPEPSPSRAEPRAWRVLGGVSAVSGVLRSMCRRATASVSCSMALALASGLRSPLCASASACFFAASARSLSRSSLRSTVSARTVTKSG